jgi:glycosyltransferase involved in cell wall biosynthesis
MRVLVLASGDLWAGAEVMVNQLVNELSTFPEVGLRVVLLNKGRLAKELVKLGIEVLVIDESKHSFFYTIRVIRKLVAEFSPDIIHSHRYKENFLAWAATCWRKNIKLVATQHGMPETVGKDVRLLSKVRNSLFFRLLSCFFVRTVLVSREMRQLLVGSYGFSFKNITVIHNGIFIPKDISHRKGLRVFIGSAGRFFPVKDFSLFVDLAHSLVRQNDTVDFVLAGDGPQHIILEEKIRSLGLQERFRILGHQDDMDAFYRSLDIYINTSVHEGIPMSVLEAMSHGLPVVAANVGGFSEIVQDGEQGFLIVERNKNVYVDRVLELILNQDLRLKMAKSARDRVVDCFSRKVMAEKYYQLYCKLLNI